MDPATDEFEAAVQAVRLGLPAAEAAGRLYEQLTPDERLGLLDGDTPFWPGLASMAKGGYNVRPYVMGAVERLGIPGIRFVDGPRGCVAGHGTAFPVSMARGATWDVALEEQVGDVIGREVREQGGNFFGGVCINLPRHPAWGRAQETYGDDPYHLGEFGAALVRGAQRWVMACAKHYALNSMENARFTLDVTIDEGALHDVYLPHFRRVVDEGVAAIMAAYNSVNGEWAGQNRYLLTEVLRDQWGWDGITVSDFIWGLRDAGASLQAGLDLEEPFAQQRDRDLRRQLESGEASWARAEQSGRRLLAAQLCSYAARRPGPFGGMAGRPARALARRVAGRAMVLLRNEPVDGVPVLPLDPAAVTSVALVGRLANAANLGDLGSSMVRPPSVVSPFDGLRAALPKATVTLVEADDPAAAALAAAAADVAVVVAGFDERDEGEYVGQDTMSRPELLALFPPRPDGDHFQLSDATISQDAGYGGDRERLTLRGVDEEIIRAVSAANPRTVVAVVAGSTVLMEGWRHAAPAILMMWYAGMEGGHALADVLTGAQDPSGRLPFAVPTSPEHLPAFDRDATTISYDRFHGQRLLDRLGVEPAFPHGFGLAYTSFGTGPVHVVELHADRARLMVSVRNTGGRDGHQVVQVYGRGPDGLALTGFAGADVPAGQAVTVPVEVSLLPLARWNPLSKRRELPAAADIVLEVGGHAHDPAAVLVQL